MPEPTIWRDGTLIPHAEATVHVLSHVAQRGSQVFDAVRVVDTAAGPAAVGLRDHAARFDRSMELMGMDPPYDIAAVERAVAEVVAANPEAGTVRLLASWTEVPASSRPASLRPTIDVAPGGDRSHPAIGPPLRIQRGTMPKVPAEILPPSLKVAAAYTAGVRQQLAAAAEGFDDVVFATASDRLAETTNRSVLVVADDRIVAPPLDSVLDGITRRFLFDLARLDDVLVEVRDVRWDEVVDATELIVTSTGRFLSPVGELDGRSYPAPGPVTSGLQRRVDELLTDPTGPVATRWLAPLGA